MSTKENNFAGQPVVFWERKNVDRCFGEEKELDNKKEIQLNMLIIAEDYRFMLTSCITTFKHNQILSRRLEEQDYGI